MLSLNKFGSGWPVLVYRHKGSNPAVFSLALGRPRANSEAWNLFLHSVAVLLELKGIPHHDAVALLMISDQDHYVCFYLLSFLLASVGLASSSCFSPWKKETKHKNRWFSHIDPSLVTFSHAKKILHCRLVGCSRVIACLLPMKLCTRIFLLCYLPTEDLLMQQALEWDHPVCREGSGSFV